jgi:hypothetical protein
MITSQHCGEKRLKDGVLDIKGNKQKEEIRYNLTHKENNYK